jgi:rod shape-determining protein MreC
MVTRQPGDRTLPTLISLLVVGVLLMTFDIRSEGGGVTGVLRSGVQTIVAPLQKGAAFVSNPVVDVVETLANLASLRELNRALQAENAAIRAELVASRDDLALLEFYERFYELEATGSDLGRTPAQVIGQPDAFDAALIIDKGSSSGIVVGQPVIDPSGYVVGSVQRVTPVSATVVPITVGPSGVAVAVGNQTGTVVAQVNTQLMRLTLDNAKEPVFAEDRVVTSSGSVRFPAGYPVGVISADAAPSGDSLIADVVPYAQADTLRLVIVLAWPPDPISAVTPDTTTTTSSTTTTVPGDGSSTSTTAGGDG